MKFSEIIKGVIGLGWIIAVAVGIWSFCSYTYNTIYHFSPLTEEGMKWQRENNPDYIQAEALKRIATEMQRNK